VVTPHIRFAAGVFVIAAGLLLGGGTVAVADPFGSGPNGDDSSSPSQGSPVGNVTDTVRETVRDVTGTLGSGGQPGHQPSTGPTSTFGSGRQSGHQPSPGQTSPTTGAGGTDTEDQKEDADRVPKAPIRSPWFPTWWRRYRMLPVRSSRLRNCRPTFPPSC
jgi:hypothetical protein